MRRALAAVSLFLAASLGCVRAEAQSAAQNQYDAGDFLAAAAAGEAEGQADAMTVAAKALLALAVRDLREPACAAWLDRAEQDAATAMALAPNASEPRLALAAALGIKGRRTSVNEALRQDYASRSKALIDQALMLSPQEPRALAMLGGWNLEVLRRGGVLGAQVMGASAKAGLRAFDRARALAPDDPAIALHYAVALLTLDARRYGEKAKALLQAAGAAKAKDAFETSLLEEARRLGAVMAAQGAEAAAAASVKSFL